MANTATITEIPDGNALESKINKVPEFGLYLKCLKDFPNDEQQISQEVAAYLQKIREPEKVRFIEGLDPEIEARAATVDVIKLISRLGLADRETLVAMGKIAGPGNVQIVPEEEGGFVDAESYLALTGRPPDAAFPVEKLPIPSTKEIRNKHIRIGLGVPIIEALAEEFIEFAKVQNLPVSAHTARRFAIRSVVAHEMGHVLDQALLSQGVSTAKKGMTMLKQKYPKLSEDYLKKIHPEHFAQGVEDLIKKELMVMLPGLDETKAGIFLEKRYADRRPRVQAVFALFQWAQQNHISLQQIRDLEVKIQNIQNKGRENPGSSLTPYFFDTLSILQYSDKPYSKNEVEYILSKDQHLSLAA